MTTAAELDIQLDPEALHPTGTTHHTFDRAWEDYEAGFPTPIIVDRDTGFLLDGNHRYAVAEEMGALDQLEVFLVTSEEWMEFCDESGWWADTDNPEPEMKKYDLMGIEPKGAAA